MKQILFIICLSLIGMSCSTLNCEWGSVCTKKECCPEEGHGRCPICFDEDYLDEINNWKKTEK